MPPSAHLVTGTLRESTPTADSMDEMPRAACGLIRRMRSHIRIGIAFVGSCLCVQAQWLNQPTPGAPRTPDGKVNMTGPVPRVNGKPDLAGIWQAQAEPRGPGLFGLGESPNSKY